jgi:hypothetical protein
MAIVNVEVVGVGFVPLNQIDPHAVAAGKPVADTAGGVWSLERSSATVDHTTVEAVLGDPGLRWLIAAAAGGVQTVTGGLVDNSDPANPIVNQLSPSRYTVSGAARQDINIAAAGDLAYTVDGNTDVEYEIEGYIVNSAGSNADYTLQPNGVSSAQSGIETSSPGSGNTTNFATTSLYLGFGLASGGSVFFRARFYAKTGQDRWFTVDYYYRNAGDAAGGFDNGAEQWAETATNITSLKVHASVAASIGIGSWVRIKVVK